MEAQPLAQSNPQKVLPQALLRTKAMIDDDTVLLGVVNCGPLSQDVRLSLPVTRNLIEWLQQCLQSDKLSTKSLAPCQMGAPAGQAPFAEFAVVGGEAPLRVEAGGHNVASLVFPPQSGDNQLSYHLNAAGTQSVIESLSTVVKVLEPFEKAFERTGLPYCAKLASAPTVQ